jgi:hypothetical protein
MENREEPVILVMQKQQSFKQSFGSCHTIGTAKGINLWVPFNQPAEVREHNLQQIFGTQILS